LTPGPSVAVVLEAFYTHAETYYAKPKLGKDGQPMMDKDGKPATEPANELSYMSRTGRESRSQWRKPHIDKPST
jgi:hypothetical protein